MFALDLPGLFLRIRLLPGGEETFDYLACSPANGTAIAERGADGTHADVHALRAHESVVYLPRPAHIAVPRHDPLLGDILWSLPTPLAARTENVSKKWVGLAGHYLLLEQAVLQKESGAPDFLHCATQLRWLLASKRSCVLMLEDPGTGWFHRKHCLVWGL